MSRLSAARLSILNTCWQADTAIGVTTTNYPESRIAAHVANAFTNSTITACGLRLVSGIVINGHLSGFASTWLLALSSFGYRLFAQSLLWLEAVSRIFLVSLSQVSMSCGLLLVFRQEWSGLWLLDWPFRIAWWFVPMGLLLTQWKRKPCHPCPLSNAGRIIIKTIW